jgi:hypothetical protein
MFKYRSEPCLSEVLMSVVIRVFAACLVGAPYSTLSTPVLQQHQPDRVRHEPRRCC